MYRTLLARCEYKRTGVLLIIKDGWNIFTHTLRARCGTFLNNDGHHSSLLTPCEQGAVHFLPMKRPHSSLLTPCKQGAVHFLPRSLPEMLNPTFFRAKNFNIFYDSEPEKFSGRPRRAPIWPEKIPIWPEKIFISEVKFSISEVENTDL